MDSPSNISRYSRANAVMRTSVFLSGVPTVPSVTQPSSWSESIKFQAWKNRRILRSNLPSQAGMARPSQKNSCLTSGFWRPEFCQVSLLVSVKILRSHFASKYICSNCKIYREISLTDNQGGRDKRLILMKWDGLLGKPCSQRFCERSDYRSVDLKFTLPSASCEQLRPLRGGLYV